MNPQLGTSKYLYNISGHRDVNATACPGNAFYATFPQLRQEVANKIAATTGSTVDHTAPGVSSLAAMVPNPSGATTIPFGLIFKEPVTGLKRERPDRRWNIGRLDDRIGDGERRALPGQREAAVRHP